MDLKHMLYYYSVMGCMTDGDNTTNPGNSNFALAFGGRSGAGSEVVTGTLLQACGKDASTGIALSTSDGVWYLGPDGLTKVHNSPAVHLEGSFPHQAWTLLTETDVLFFAGGTLRKSWTAPQGSFEVGGSHTFNGFYLATDHGFYFYHSTYGDELQYMNDIPWTPVGIRSTSSSIVYYGGMHGEPLVYLLTNIAIYGYVGGLNVRWSMFFNGDKPLDAAIENYYTHGILVKSQEGGNRLVISDGFESGRYPLSDVRYIYRDSGHVIVVTNSGKLYSLENLGSPVEFADLGSPVLLSAKLYPLGSFIATGTHYAENASPFFHEIKELPESMSSMAMTSHGIVLARANSGALYQYKWDQWNQLTHGLTGEILAVEGQVADSMFVWTTTGYWYLNDSQVLPLSITGDLLTVTGTRFMHGPCRFVITTKGVFVKNQNYNYSSFAGPMWGPIAKAGFYPDMEDTVFIQKTNGEIWEVAHEDASFTQITGPGAELLSVSRYVCYYRINGEIYLWSNKSKIARRFYGNFTLIQSDWGNSIGDDGLFYRANVAYDGTDLFWYRGEIFHAEYETTAESFTVFGNGYLLQDDLNEEA